MNNYSGGGKKGYRGDNSMNGAGYGRCRGWGGKGGGVGEGGKGGQLAVEAVEKKPRRSAARTLHNRCANTKCGRGSAYLFAPPGEENYGRVIFGKTRAGGGGGGEAGEAKVRVQAP